MAQSDEDLQPKPLTGGGGIGRFCRNAKALNGNGPPGQPPVAGQRVLWVKIREGPPGKKHLLPEVTTRGKPPARGQPVSLNCLAMSTFRRRTSCQETCPPGAGMAKPYPDEKEHWFH